MLLAEVLEALEALLSIALISAASRTALVDSVLSFKICSEAWAGKARIHSRQEITLEK